MYRRTMGLGLWLAILLLIARASATGYAKEPDFAGYDVFGPYTVPLNDIGNGLKIYADLRSFIWSHWHGHRRGYAILTEISVEESVPCQTTYIIEPDKYDNWHIDKRWKCKKGHPRAGRSIITSVRRVVRDRSGYRTDVAVADTADVPSESYFLVLLDVSGQVVREL